MTVAWTLDAEVRALLVCPLCRGELTDVRRGLLCPVDLLVFPVRDGSAWMVREVALAPESDELAQA